MTDPTARDEANADETAASTGASADSNSAPEAPAAEAQHTEVAELKDRLLRTLADMENLRRRTEREVVDARAYGIAAFARDMLGVADNMRRALDAVGAEQREAADANLKGLIDGIELTERELHKVLEKHGIAKLDPQGEKFDPNFHQAMFELPDPSVPSGTVVQVVQSGYRIGERVLRPALVAVAKGGPRSQPEGQRDPATANDDGRASG